MTKKWLLYWSPRALALLFAGFLTIFALDVFGEGYPFWELLTALLIHLLPVYIVAGVLLSAWRHEWLGALLYALLALVYLMQTGDRFHWSVHVLLTAPLVLIAMLFWLNWAYREQLRPVS